MRALWVSAVALLVACGGESSRSPGSSGGGDTASGASGGAASGGHAGGSSGGAAGMSAPLADCDEPLPVGTACAVPAAHCGGPCVNSWQADNVCKDGLWTMDGAVARCGPNAADAPQCRNAFEGGALTPCCPEGGLECGGKPNGYPGFGCTPGDQSFCSCGCYDGAPSCGC